MWLIAHVCMWLIVKIMLDIKYISDATQWILTKFPPIWGLGGPQSSLTDPKVILTRWIAIYPNNLKVTLLTNIRNKPEFSRLFTLLYILGIFWESFSPPIIEIWIRYYLHWTKISKRNHGRTIKMSHWTVSNSKLKKKVSTHVKTTSENNDIFA